MVSKLEEALKEHPVLLDYIKQNLAVEEPALWSAWIQRVDESAFGIVAWVESMLMLDQWLKQRGLSLLFKDKIEYISCASESGGNTNLCHLPLLVHDFLEQYGCERAVKSN